MVTEPLGMGGYKLGYTYGHRPNRNAGLWCNTHPQLATSPHLLHAVSEAKRARAHGLCQNRRGCHHPAHQSFEAGCGLREAALRDEAVEVGHDEEESAHEAESMRANPRDRQQRHQPIKQHTSGPLVTP